MEFQPSILIEILKLKDMIDYSNSDLLKLIYICSMQFVCQRVYAQIKKKSLKRLSLETCSLIQLNVTDFIGFTWLVSKIAVYKSILYQWSIKTLMDSCI